MAGESKLRLALPYPHFPLFPLTDSRHLVPLSCIHQLYKCLDRPLLVCFPLIPLFNFIFKTALRLNMEQSPAYQEIPGDKTLTFKEYHEEFLKDFEKANHSRISEFARSIYHNGCLSEEDHKKFRDIMRKQEMVMMVTGQMLKWMDDNPGDVHAYIRLNPHDADVYANIMKHTEQLLFKLRASSAKGLIPHVPLPKFPDEAAKNDKDGEVDLLQQKLWSLLPDPSPKKDGISGSDPKVSNALSMTAPLQSPSSEKGGNNAESILSEAASKTPPLQSLASKEKSSTIKVGGHDIDPNLSTAVSAPLPLQPSTGKEGGNDADVKTSETAPKTPTPASTTKEEGYNEAKFMDQVNSRFFAIKSVDKPILQARSPPPPAVVSLVSSPSSSAPISGAPSPLSSTPGSRAPSPPPPAPVQQAASPPPPAPVQQAASPPPPAPVQQAASPPLPAKQGQTSRTKPNRSYGWNEEEPLWMSKLPNPSDDSFADSDSDDSDDSEDDDDNAGANQGKAGPVKALVSKSLEDNAPTAPAIPFIPTQVSHNPKAAVHKPERSQPKPLLNDARTIKAHMSTSLADPAPIALATPALQAQTAPIARIAPAPPSNRGIDPNTVFPNELLDKAYSFLSPDEVRKFKTLYHAKTTEYCIAEMFWESNNFDLDGKFHAMRLDQNQNIMRKDVTSTVMHEFDTWTVYLAYNHQAHMDEKNGERKMRMVYALSALSQLPALGRINKVVFDGWFDLPPAVILQNGLSFLPSLAHITLWNCFTFNSANIMEHDFSQLKNIDVKFHYTHPTLYADAAKAFKEEARGRVYTALLFRWQHQMHSNVTHQTGRDIFLNSINRSGGKMQEFIVKELHLDQFHREGMQFSGLPALITFLNSATSQDEMHNAWLSHLFFKKNLNNKAFTRDAKEFRMIPCDGDNCGVLPAICFDDKAWQKHLKDDIVKCWACRFQEDHVDHFELRNDFLYLGEMSLGDACLNYISDSKYSFYNLSLPNHVLILIDLTQISPLSNASPSDQGGKSKNPQFPSLNEAGLPSYKKLRKVCPYDVVGKQCPHRGHSCPLLPTFVSLFFGRVNGLMLIQFRNADKSAGTTRNQRHKGHARIGSKIAARTQQPPVDLPIIAALNVLS